MCMDARCNEVLSPVAEMWRGLFFKGKLMNIILGTMTFGEQLWEKDVIEIINMYLEYGYNQLDTAYVYNNGKSEELIGRAISCIPRESIKIDTKVNPRITGKLDSEAVRLQLEMSLVRLKTDYIDTYYLHFPDRCTPIESVLEEVNSYYQNGCVRHLGLSNFPAKLVRTIYDICDKNNWVKPTVYEGLYNPLSRKAEGELEKCLNDLDIVFNAYNPLAGGLLTDKYSNYFESPLIGRFTYRPNYKDRYWKPVYFEAIDNIKLHCAKHNISITEAAFRWMVHSSMLSTQREDGIIIGVSKKNHMKDNIDYIQKEELPKEIIECFESAWLLCKCDSPEYYRYYGDKK